MPARGQVWQWAFHTCNGLSMNADVQRWGAPKLWEDVLRLHAATPLHCCVGGGDQIYNDGVWSESSLKEWLNISNANVRPCWHAAVPGCSCRQCMELCVVPSAWKTQRSALCSVAPASHPHAYSLRHAMPAQERYEHPFTALMAAQAQNCELTNDCPPPV